MYQDLEKKDLRKLLPHRQALSRAIEICYNQGQLAHRINTYIERHGLRVRKVQQQNISNWLLRDKKIPALYHSIIEAITHGRVKATELLIKESEPATQVKCAKQSRPIVYANTISLV